MMANADRNTWGVYCRTARDDADHDRCGMNPCGCPHHDDVTRKLTFGDLVDTRYEKETTVSRHRNWTAEFATDDQGRRICPTCRNLLAHTGGRYPRECADCKNRLRIVTA